MKWYRNLSINNQLAAIMIGLVIGFGAIGFSFYQVLVIEKSSEAKTAETTVYMEQAKQARLNLYVAQSFGKGFQVSNRLEELEGFDTTNVQRPGNNGDITRQSSVAGDERTGCTVNLALYWLSKLFLRTR